MLFQLQNNYNIAVMIDDKHYLPEDEISEETLSEKQSVKDALDYSGIAVNKGDDGKCDSSLVKERTRTLNNNPRNGDMNAGV